MKRFSILLTVLMAVPLLARAQDAATEEQLTKLRAEITALQASNIKLQKDLSDVLKEVQELRSQMSRPTGNYADAEDVKRLADSIKEVDRKRASDRELILNEIRKLGKSISLSPTPAPSSSADRDGWEYEIKQGDTLSALVTYLREQKGMKITVDDILKANRGLKPTSMKVGDKVFIPSK